MKRANEGREFAPSEYFFTLCQNTGKKIAMLSVIVAAAGLSFFFWVVLYFCVLTSRREVNRQPDSPIDMMQKSPFGRWRY